MIAGHPVWAGGLLGLYWQLRDVRKHCAAARRKAYRRVKAERLRLEASGLDGELIRRFCRYLSNPRNEAAAARFRDYEAALSGASVIAAKALADALASSGGMGAVAPHIASAESRTGKQCACVVGVVAGDDPAPCRQVGS